MPLTTEDRRSIIAELRAMDPAKWAMTIKYHRDEIQRLENK